MAGLITVDFAGTKEEAVEYASIHSTAPVRLRVGNKPNITPEGCPMLTVYWTSRDNREAALALLAKLGWGEGEFHERRTVTRTETTTIFKR